MYQLVPPGVSCPHCEMGPRVHLGAGGQSCRPLAGGGLLAFAGTVPPAMSPSHGLLATFSVCLPRGDPWVGQGWACGVRHTWLHPALLLTSMQTWAVEVGNVASGSSSIERGQRVLTDSRQASAGGRCPLALCAEGPPACSGPLPSGRPRPPSLPHLPGHVPALRPPLGPSGRQSGPGRWVPKRRGGPWWGACAMPGLEIRAGQGLNGCSVLTLSSAPGIRFLGRQCDCRWVLQAR